MNETSDKEQLIAEILKHWRPSHSRCGKLVQRRDAFWHYSVAVSNTHALAWSGIPHETGHMTMHEIGPEFTETVNVVYLFRDQVRDNLIASVFAFHNVWQYGWGWNCEHWARLVATGEPKSYQVANAFFGVLNLFGFCYRSEAIPWLNGNLSSLKEGNFPGIKNLPVSTVIVTG